MPTVEIPKQKLNVDAVWAIFWRAVVLTICLGFSIASAFFARWWLSAILLALFFVISFIFSRTSPSRKEPPQREFGGGTLL
jgi:uncharacterized membrane protein